jgi:hypothetical protein
MESVSKTAVFWLMWSVVALSRAGSPGDSAVGLAAVATRKLCPPAPLDLGRSVLPLDLAVTAVASVVVLVVVEEALGAASAVTGLEDPVAASDIKEVAMGLADRLHQTHLQAPAVEEVAVLLAGMIAIGVQLVATVNP